MPLSNNTACNSHSSSCFPGHESRWSVVFPPSRANVCARGTFLISSFPLLPEIDVSPSSRERLPVLLAAEQLHVVEVQGEGDEVRARVGGHQHRPEVGPPIGERGRDEGGEDGEAEAAEEREEHAGAEHQIRPALGRAANAFITNYTVVAVPTKNAVLPNVLTSILAAPSSDWLG